MRVQLAATKIYPVHPFGSLPLVVEDSLRVLCVVAGFVIVFGAIAIAANAKKRQFYGATLYGLLTVIFLGASASLTEVYKIGHPIQEFGFWWRLPLNVVGLVSAAFTTIAVKRYPLRGDPHLNPFHRNESD